MTSHTSTLITPKGSKGSGGGRWRRLISTGSLGCLVVLAACGNDDGTRADVPPGNLPPGHAVGNFTTLDDVALASDAFVVGTVIEAEPGRTVGDIHYRELKIRVSKVLHGSVPTDIIVIEEEGWIVEPGQGEIPMSPFHWDEPAAVGQTWIAALSHKEIASKETGTPTYAVLATAGFFLVQADGLRTSSDVTDDAGNPVASLTRDELIAEIADVAIPTSSSNV